MSIHEKTRIAKKYTMPLGIAIFLFMTVGLASIMDQLGFVGTIIMVPSLFYMAGDALFKGKFTVWVIWKFYQLIGLTINHKDINNAR